MTEPMSEDELDRVVGRRLTLPIPSKRKTWWRAAFDDKPSVIPYPVPKGSCAMRSWRSEKGRSPDEDKKNKTSMEPKQDQFIVKLNVTKARGIEIPMDHRKYATVEKAIISAWPKFDIERAWNNSPEDNEWNSMG